MASKNTAPEVPVVAVGETNLFSVSCLGVLDSGELISSLSAVVDNDNGDDTDLTIGNLAVSTEDLTINGKTVATGKAIQFSVTGATVANSPYTLKATFVTDSNPAQTKVKYVKFQVKGS